MEPIWNQFRRRPHVIIIPTDTKALNSKISRAGVARHKRLTQIIEKKQAQSNRWDALEEA